MKLINLNILYLFYAVQGAPAKREVKVMNFKQVTILQLTRSDRGGQVIENH